MLEEILRSGFSSLSLPLDESALLRYRQYRDHLAEINEVMNLTAITEEDAVANLHFLDSAYLLRLESFGGKKAIDIGTGAGFPGLALKIACPELSLTLLDSLDKRIGFLSDTCSILGFSDVSCVHARAEEIPAGFRENYDIALSRAVARLNILCELCLPYVKPGGCFIAMKGPDFDAELEEAKPCIRLLGGKTEKCETYTIPGTDVTHSAIVIRKISPSPSKYPRRWAQIKKSPLV